MPDPASPLAPEITPEEFAPLHQAWCSAATGAPGDPAPVLLDVREPWEYDHAHLAGSLLMPMGDVPSRAHQELDPDAHIVVVCHHGARSLSVTMWLRAQGFDHAQSLAGGVDAWARQVDPALPRY